MEFEIHASNLPCLYMTAPNSPNGCSRSNNSSMEFYYSAPASPRRRGGCPVFKAGDDHLGLTLDEFEFEFETSKRFSGQLQYSDASESPVSGKRSHERGDSLPAMAFADELFLNGLVMPLKPPPRLHCDTDFSSFSQKSPLASPKSPRTVCRIPFARKSSWNDGFDPFMVALEKVREEKRGRNSHPRRSRSYSPFRAMSRSSSVATADGHSQDLSMEPMPAPAPAPTYSGPLDFKGSSYARWVRDQTRHGLSPKSSSRFLFRQQVRPLNGSDKNPTPAAKQVGKNVEVSKVQKLKGLLVRYASFGRGNSGSKQSKTSTEARNLGYFSRMSFKLKGNAHGNTKKMIPADNTKKKIPADTKMAVVQYKPSIAICLGYGGSPVKVK